MSATSLRLVKAWLIDPRNLPTAPVLKVLANGTLQADADVCAAVGLPVEHLTRTIELLSLNMRRLREARHRFTDALTDRAAAIGDEDEQRRWIGALLSPHADGSLRRFFTTSRSYFGELAERVLGQYVAGLGVVMSASSRSTLGPSRCPRMGVDSALVPKPRSSTDTSHGTERSPDLACQSGCQWRPG